jgi:hypothetical protein
MNEIGTVASEMRRGKETWQFVISVYNVSYNTPSA